MVMSGWPGRCWRRAFVERAALYRHRQRVVKTYAREEVVTVPGLGSMLLPGKVDLQRITAGVLTPATCRRRWPVFHPLWRAVDYAARNQSTFLLETAPKGFSPDWVRYEKDKAGS